MLPNESFRAMLQKSPNVLIAVCTYKRPKMLQTCLESLLSMRPTVEFRHDILVIDNDSERSGYQAFLRAEMCAYQTDMIYLAESERGIAKARNRALDYALAGNYDHIAFLDDDETADKDWLYELMRPCWRNKPVVYGRRIMDYSQVPTWARPKAQNRLAVENGQPCKAFTHNVRVSRAVFEKIRFDESLGLAGGEDGDYFARARKAGFPAYFASKAITHEFAHPERMTFLGQLNRAYWTGASSMRELITEKGASYRLRKLPSIMAGPFIGAVLGLAGAALCCLNRQRGFALILKGAKHAAKQWGRLMAVWGHIPQSYAKTVGG